MNKANGSQKQAGTAILLPHKVVFKQKVFRF